MQDKYILKRDHLRPFLRKLAKEYRIVAPVKNRHGDTLFSPITSVDQEEIDLSNQPQNSLKDFLFPQSEVMSHYSVTTPGDYRFSAAREEVPSTIYFGVRPCDLAAALYMDVIFLRESTDPLYLRRRQEAVLVGLNCNAPFRNCFCNGTDNGPFAEYGADLQLTDLGDRFLIEVGRARGNRLIHLWLPFFNDGEAEDSQAHYQAFLEARGGFRRQVHVEQAIKRLKGGKVEESVWSFLSQRCQDCGGCAYVCPTCTCFTISDLPLSESSGQRLRSWDACTFSGFTRMAGGHNPIERKRDAIRQRFMHKLCYDVESHSRPSCVGCGRCVDICFGGTDIVRFITMSCQEK